MSDPVPTSRVVVDVVNYAAARVLLAVALSALIYGIAVLIGVREFPLVLAVLLGIVLALPVGMWLFTPLRRRATAGLAVVGARRREDKEQLRARLRGESSPEE